MGLFDWLFRKATSAGTPSGMKRYDYLTGNIELAIRVNAGEALATVLKEISKKWKPGNEHLWDEYDIESLIDTAEKRSQVVNCLLYARLSIYRCLRAKGNDISGRDPFGYLAEAPEQVRPLQARFPEMFPSAFEGMLPPIKCIAIEMPHPKGDLED